MGGLAGKAAGNTLIVLIGMTRICMDFEYKDGTAAGIERGGILLWV